MDKNDTLTVIKAILGGMAISLGCIAYMTIDNKCLGAFIFSLGLCSIFTFKWKLFTGAICESGDPLTVIFIYLGNCLGALLTAFIFMFANGFAVGRSMSMILSEQRFSKGPFKLIFSGVLCEICIFIAVNGYKKARTEVGRYLITIMAVMTFVLSGFEHSIADIFYSLTGSPSVFKFLSLNVFVLIGNVLGAFLMRFLYGIINECEDEIRMSE